MASFEAKYCQTAFPTPFFIYKITLIFFPEMSLGEPILKLNLPKFHGSLGTFLLLSKKIRVCAIQE